MVATLITVSSPAGAEWKISTYPFLPYLQGSKTGPVCQLLLKQAIAQFKSDAALIDLNQLDTESEPELRVVQWEETPYPEHFDEKRRSLDTLFHASLDLDGDGTKEEVVYRSNTWRWRPPAITAGVFESERAFQAALHDYSSAENVMAVGHQFFSGTGTMNTLFNFKGSFYFVETGANPGGQQGDTVSVNRLTGTGVTEAVCTIVVRPKATRIQRYPSIAAYTQMLANIGSGGPDCGTAHLMWLHELRGRGAVERLGYRPWATQNPGSPAYDSRMEKLLMEWSYDDVWNQREYRTFVQQRADARRALRRYLALEYGVPSNSLDDASGTLLDELTGSFFMFPSDNYEFYGTKYANYIREIVDNRFELKAKLSPSAGVVLMPFIVDNPELLERAMALGIDPEQPNWFGKTLLMVAAHLNRVDAVRILLKSGASVKAVTRDSEKRDYCSGKLIRLNRSALTYAAENASPEIIVLLVDAGSDTSIKDTKGNPLEWYLAKNPRISRAEQNMTISELVATYHKRNRPIAASFNCNQAHSRSEKAICGNTELKLLDRELGRAYGIWLGKSASPQEDKSAQRAWIKYRNDTCGNNPKSRYVLCLQRETRARTRMYQNKLAQVRKSDTGK